MKPSHCPSALVLALTLVLALPTLAGPGHDHDHDHQAAPTGAPALPRFAASSELFELVGVLDGKTLTLYLDRAATNEPLPKAALELELAGSKLTPKPQADGSFVAELAAVPGDGLHAVTATVIVGEESDLLAGELDLHRASAPADAHPRAGWWQRGLTSAAVMAAIAGLAFLSQRKRAQRAQRLGAKA